jgi:hypothetical protein
MLLSLIDHSLAVTEGVDVQIAMTGRWPHGGFRGTPVRNLLRPELAIEAVVT